MFGLFDSAVCAILSAGRNSGTTPHRPDVIPETGSGRVLQTNPPGLPNLIDLVEQHQAIAVQPRLISHMLATRHRLVPAAPVPLTPEGREPPLGPYRLKRDRPRESPQDPRSEAQPRWRPPARRPLPTPRSPSPGPPVRRRRATTTVDSEEAGASGEDRDTQPNARTSQRHDTGQYRDTRWVFLASSAPVSKVAPWSPHTIPMIGKR